MSRDRIRLVQITHGMGIGGMERVTLDLCRCLDPETYDISVYCTHIRGPLAGDLEALGVPVIHEPVHSRAGHWSRPVRIYRYLRQVRPDIVHTQATAAFQDAALPVRMVGVPAFVHTDHCKFYPRVKRRHMIWERLLSPLVDSFCAVSEHTRRELVTHAGIRAERVEVVLNGFDFATLPGPADRRELRETLGLGEGDRLLGSIARLEWQKGHELLIRAMPGILARVPSAHAVIVGGGSHEAELRRLIEELGLEDRIHMTGWRKDAVRFLAAIDLFVMSSNFEGMPISLLEAMASGRPILSTAVGGVPEVVIDGETGRLIHSRDPEEFARAAAELLADTNRLEEYGRAGRRRYEEMFRVANMVEAYDRIYRRCLRRHGRL